jgi:hypothetical protein
VIVEGNGAIANPTADTTKIKAAGKVVSAVCTGRRNLCRRTQASIGMSSVAYCIFVIFTGDQL